MTKEELIGKLQMVYVGDRNALNELVGYYDGLKQVIERLQQENEQLQNNWNELKKWIRDYLKLFDNPDYFEEQSIEDLNEVLNKMQELEGSND